MAKWVLAFAVATLNRRGLKGTITPGKLAGLAVFDTNLVAAARTDPQALPRAKVRYTIVGGKVRYEPAPH